MDGRFTNRNIAAPNELVGSSYYAFKKRVTLSSRVCLYGETYPLKQSMTHLAPHNSHPYNNAGTIFSYSALTNAIGKLESPAVCKRPRIAYIPTSNSSRHGKNVPAAVTLIPRKRRYGSGVKHVSPKCTLWDFAR